MINPYFFFYFPDFPSEIMRTFSNVPLLLTFALLSSLISLMIVCYILNSDAESISLSDNSRQIVAAVKALHPASYSKFTQSSSSLPQASSSFASQNYTKECQDFLLSPSSRHFNSIITLDSLLRDESEFSAAMKWRAKHPVSIPYYFHGQMEGYV